MDTTELAKRMKDYEDVGKTRLMNKSPVCIRLDGVSFHTFTKGFDRPFDNVLNETMRLTMKNLCEEMSGCVFGYTQSDEITLILADYFKKESQPWFGNVKRKVESVSAAMATKFFNLNFAHVIHDALKNEIGNSKDEELLKRIMAKYRKYLKKCGMAMFDSRAFNLPIFEVTNNLIWRQDDCVRNSIQSVGQANFSHSKLQNKNCNQIKEMLVAEKGIDWEKLPTALKRGTCCIKVPTIINEGTENEAVRNKWVIDYEIPKFKDNREYIESRVNPL